MNKIVKTMFWAVGGLAWSVISIGMWQIIYPQDRLLAVLSVIACASMVLDNVKNARESYNA